MRNRSVGRIAAVVAAVVAAVIAAACAPDTTAGINTAQALVELGDALNAVREEQSILQGQLDSLREVVARQDTVLRQIANIAGVPVPAR